MQPIKTEQSNSFYESFSDLIFCTLVLFILLFLVMALNVDKQANADIEGPSVERLTRQIEQLKVELHDRNKLVEKIGGKNIAEIAKQLDQQREEMRQAVEDQRLQLDADRLAERSRLQHVRDQLKELVGSNRFTGRSGNTTLRFAADVTDPLEFRYTLVPEDMDSAYSVARNGESKQEEKVRQSMAVIQFGLHRRTSRKYTRLELNQMLKAMTPCVVDGKPQRLSAVSLTPFGAYASGVVDSDFDVISISKFRKFQSLDMFAGLEYTKLAPKGETFTIPFQLNQGDKRRPILLGNIGLSTDDAVGFIKAFSGRGVSIEVEPSVPDWFLKKVLKPTGCTNRAPTLTIDSTIPE